MRRSRSATKTLVCAWLAMMQTGRHLTRRRGVVSAFTPSWHSFHSKRAPCTGKVLHNPKTFQAQGIPFLPYSNRLTCSHTSPSPRLNARTSIFGDEEPEAQLLEGLNENQVAAVTQPHHSIVRVIAGPGSGKTRVLTSRIAWLLHSTARTHDRILGVTFTKKAAGEMQRRLESMVDPMGRVTLGTFHSVCAKILRFNGQLLETLPSVQAEMHSSLNTTLLDGGFTIIDQAEKERKVKEALKGRKIDLKTFHYAGKEMSLRNVVGALSHSKQAFAENKNPFKQSKNEPLSPLMQVAQKIYYDYRQMLLTTNCLDFDDLILLSRELLQQHRSVQERLQSYWIHVLVDEYQDTSRVQMDVIQLLAKSSLFVVGDADQSIYSWRGAHAGSLSTFDREFGHKHVNGVRTVYLMENYRSTSSIVRAAQKVIAQSGNISGENQLRQKMIPQREKGAPPKIIACEDGEHEANFVLDKIKLNIQQGNYSPDSSIAVIYRTNAQSRELEECCVRNGVSYVIFGAATSFYKRQEVKDCLCFARWLYNGWDREAMLRAMVTPRKGLGETAIRDFEDYCSTVQSQWTVYQEEHGISGGIRPTPLDILCFVGGDSSWISMPNDEIPPPGMTMNTRFVRPLREFGQQMAEIRRAAETFTVDKLLDFVVKQVGLMAHLEKFSKTNEEFKDREGNVLELLQASSRYSDDGPSLGDSGSTIDGNDMFAQSPLANFLDDVSLVTEVKDETADPNAEKRLVVSLMTIHASKGMEFDTAFVVGLEEGTIPTYQAKEEGEDSIKFNEERRLLYVAMTRAKSELFMSWRKEVPIFTNKGIQYINKGRSRFLNDLTKKASNGTNPKRASKPLLKGSSHSAQRGNASKASGAPRGVVPAYRTPPSPRRDQSTNPKRRRAANPSRSGTLEQNRLHLEPRGRASRTADAMTPRRSSQHRPASAATEPRRSAAAGNQIRPTPNQKPVVTAKLKPVQPDASWFFPTGSKVRHTKLGVGIVVPATQPSQQHVHVKFSNGQTKKFPGRCHISRSREITPLQLQSRTTKIGSIVSAPSSPTHTQSLATLTSNDSCGGKVCLVLPKTLLDLTRSKRPLPPTTNGKLTNQRKKKHTSTMKLTNAILSTSLFSVAAAFAPSSISSTSSAMSMSSTEAPEVTEPEAPAPPAVAPINGWVPDASKPCYGLPGVSGPLGFFDPLGFSKDKELGGVKRLREAEIMHGRVAMMATVGYLIGENTPTIAYGFAHPTIANNQIPEVPGTVLFPFFLAINIAEALRASRGWVEPGLGPLFTLRENYYPGDIGFDPLGLKPSSPADFASMQTKELNNGRLAMIAAAGMCVQEQVNGQPILGNLGLNF